MKITKTLFSGFLKFDCVKVIKYKFYNKRSPKNPTNKFKKKTKNGVLRLLTGNICRIAET